MHNNEGIRFKSSSTKVPPLSVSHPPFCSQSLTSNLSKAQSLVDQFFNSLKLPPDVNKNEGIRIQSSSIKVPSLPFRNPSSTPPLSVSRLPFCSQSLTPNLSKAQSLVDQFFNSLKCPPGVNKNEGIRFKSSSIDPSSTPPLSVSRLPFCSQSLTSTLSKAQSSVAQFFKSLKWTPGVNKCPTRAYNGLVEVKEKEALLKSGETRREGQVYSKDQGKRDVETVLSMGTMENLSIFPQPAGDSGKVDSVTNSVERVNGWFSNGGGIACGITNGPLSGLMGSFAFAHQNLFGKNQKVNVSLERGLIDSIFRLSYTDPWIQGGDNHTSRSIMIQKARRPGTLVHGNQPDGSNLTIGRLMAGIEFSRFIKPNWSGTTGITFQRAGARDDRGDPVVKDFYNSALTASGKTHDDMLVAKVESVYTSDSGSSMFGVSMEQGIPLFPGWLLFSRANSRARTGFTLGPASVLLNLSGGHVMGNFPPHEAFAIGGANSVRGYEDGAVGSGRSYVVGSGEISFPLFGPVDGAVFADYGTDLGSGSSVPGDPAGARVKPGSGYGYGVGFRIKTPLGPLRLDYAVNDRDARMFHYGIDHRS